MTSGVGACEKRPKYGEPRVALKWPGSGGGTIGRGSTSADDGRAERLLQLQRSSIAPPVTSHVHQITCKSAAAPRDQVTQELTTGQSRPSARLTELLLAGQTSACPTDRAVS